MKIRPPIYGAVFLAFASLLAFFPMQATAGNREGLEFVVSGAQGYEIRVTASEESAKLVASRNHAAVSYMTEDARFDGRRLTATFGDLGRIVVTFRPSDRAHVGRRFSGRIHCAWEQVSVQGGLFVGQIEFRGERRFTRVSARHARGHLFRLRRDGCPGAEDGHSSAIEHREARSRGPRLEALGIWRSGQTLSFHAGRDALEPLRNFGGGTIEAVELGSLSEGGIPFSVWTFEWGHRMTIFRLAVARGPSTSFEFDRSPPSAVLRPPAPFSGVGRLTQCPSRRWKGSLAVSLPGAGKVSLTTRPIFGVPRLEPSPPCPD